MNLIPYLYYLSLFIDNLIKVPAYFKTHIEITSSMAPRCLGSKKSGVLIKNFSSLIRRIFGRSKVVDTILIFAVVLKSRQLYHQDLNIIFDIIGIQLNLSPLVLKISDPSLPETNIIAGDVDSSIKSSRDSLKNNK